MTVYFIGAGPGDPDLVTVKGQRLLQRCPVVLYAGSLVPEELLNQHAPGAEVINSAPLALEAIVERMVQAHAAGQDVARVHSGDPSIYGAVGEQMRRLRAAGIAYEVIPGVSATSAAAAALGNELTLSGVAQSIIMTRYAGKTPMPERENLKDLARHGATLAIHLGVTRMHKVVADLIPDYGEDCPVAVCYRVGWPDELILRGTLTDITEQVRAARITRTALIMVGWVLANDDFNDSYLYSADKAHIFRPKSGKRSRRLQHDGSQ